MRLSQPATWEIFVPSTGRTVSESSDHSLVRSWMESAPNEIGDHEGARKFRVSLDNFEPTKDCVISQLYRGISFSDDQVPTRYKMGPPSRGECKDGGRYHTANNPVLYLSESQEGVKREREAWEATGVPFVQKYQLLLNQLKIADFTGLGSKDFLTHVFLWAERCDKDKYGPDSYAFSQAVASLVSEKFDGMRVPGVRGDADSTYSNVVLFNPHEPEGRWKDWLDPSDPFLLEGSDPTVNV